MTPPPHVELLPVYIIDYVVSTINIFTIHQDVYSTHQDTKTVAGLGRLLNTGLLLGMSRLLFLFLTGVCKCDILFLFRIEMTQKYIWYTLQVIVLHGVTF